jgi:hypothetical protein
MNPLTSKDLARIREIVNGRWTSIGIDTFGMEATIASYPEIERLVTLGYLAQEAAERIDVLADAYVFGYMRRKMEQEGVNVEKITLDEFHAILEKNPMPLPQARINAIEYAKKWGGQYVRSVAERAAGRTISSLADIDKDLDLTENFVGEATANAIEKRISADSLAKLLRAETGDNLTDWDRVAITEIQDVTERGYADELIATFGEDVLVAKVVNPDACKYCKKLYLDENGQPKIFKLKDMMKHGDNVGLKKEQWKAVVGPVHPWCHCVLMYVPEGFAFNESGELRPIKPAPKAP